MRRADWPIFATATFGKVDEHEPAAAADGVEPRPGALKQFYQEGLGLKLLRSSDTFAEFDTQAGVPLCIKLAQRCEGCFDIGGN